MLVPVRLRTDPLLLRVALQLACGLEAMLLLTPFACLMGLWAFMRHVAAQSAGRFYTSIMHVEPYLVSSYYQLPLLAVVPPYLATTGQNVNGGEVASKF